MAEQNESAQEKTEQATPKRLLEGRRKGQVPRSRDLATMVMLLGSGVALALTGAHMGTEVGGIMHRYFDLTPADIFVAENLLDLTAHGILQGVYAVLPFLGLAAVIAFFAPLGVGGWIMSGEQVSPDLKRLDPIKGLTRVFGVRGVSEMFKALAKFLVVGIVAAVAMWWQIDDLFALGRGAAQPAIVESMLILVRTFVIVSAATVLIAVVDVPLQLWQFARQMKMSRQEVKDELKETEGRPEIKSKVRQMQYEIASRRMMEEVPKADVIITNPTHFAVALRYDPDAMHAPKVVASGADQVALRIREVGRAYEVTCIEAPALARALFHTTRIGDDIPRALYLAVAQVLAYVFQLRQGEAVDAASPDPDVPEEYRY